MKLGKAFFEEIEELIHSARRAVSRGVDLLQVYSNFEIGRRIVEQEQKGKGRAEYGQEVIKALAERLIAEFGRGYGTSSLEYMRKFFLAYQGRVQISQSVIGKLVLPAIPQSMIGELQASKQAQSNIAQAAFAAVIPVVIGDSQSTAETLQPRPFTLSWTHYIFLLTVKNSDERSFYEIESAAGDWTVRELKRQFDTSLYERLALSRDKEGIRKLAQEGQIIAQPTDLLKEPLALEFLGLSERVAYSESGLEGAIISEIEQFLLELGKGFLFEARQKRFTFDSDHFFVDLVFYNRLLRCYVLIDLKLGKLTHQDLGQMQMYVNYFDRFVKTEAENATIGIVLCRQKNKAIVEITLPKDANIHASEYQLYLPSKEELQRKLIAMDIETGGGK